MIDGRRDYEGLRIAASEMFVEAFLRRETDEVLEASPRETAIADLTRMLPKRTVSPGYYGWVSYLLWLRAVAALPGSNIALLADEAEGIVIVNDAERDFRVHHPPCGRCGAFNEESAIRCRKCGRGFSG